MGELAIVRTFSFSWSILLACCFSIFSIVFILKYKVQGSRALGVVSLLFFIFYNLGIILCVLGIFGSGSVEATFFYFLQLLLIIITLFGAIASIYHHDTDNLLFQKIRNITVFLFSSIVIIYTLFIFGRALYTDYKIGMIGGISRGKAIEIAKNEINPDIKTGVCNTDDYPYPFHGEDGPALYTVSCEIYFGSTDKIFMTRDIDISAKDGKIIHLDNEYKVQFEMTKNGLPVVNTHYFSGRMADGNRYGDYLDYGATDQSGLVTLLVIPDYTTRIYNLNYEYVDLVGIIDQNYEINWDSASQLPKGGLLFQQNPYGPSYSSPYDNSPQAQAKITETGIITTFYYDPQNALGPADLNKPGNKQFNGLSFKVENQNTQQTVILDPNTKFEKNGVEIPKASVKDMLQINNKITVEYYPIDSNHYYTTKIILY